MKEFQVMVPGVEQISDEEDTTKWGSAFEDDL